MENRYHYRGIHGDDIVIIVGIHSPRLPWDALTVRCLYGPDARDTLEMLQHTVASAYRIAP